MRSGLSTAFALVASSRIEAKTRSLMHECRLGSWNTVLDAKALAIKEMTAMQGVAT
jgi:hypothetical protein